MSKPSCWILRCENRLLTTTANGAGAISPVGPASDFGSPENALLVGELQGFPCYAADIEQLPEIPSGEIVSLRSIFPLGGAETFALAGRASQLLDWRNQHRFCGKCGTGTAMKSGELAMLCPRCGLIAYPRISPEERYGQTQTKSRLRIGSRWMLYRCCPNRSVFLGV